jgi:hypothetical protein
MSASTGTIQRPASQGSILNAVAMAAAVLLAAALAWGALGLTAPRVVNTPVPAPIVLDKGSRGEITAPVAAPKAAPRSGGGYILDRGGRDDTTVTNHGGMRAQ